MKILLLGSGGREHALAWKIAQSPLCKTLYIAPGNAGTAQCGTNVQIGETNFEEIMQFIVNQDINMLVVGPEQPLVEGLTDAIKSNVATQNVMVIGPSRAGAALEGSKDFAKQFMYKYGIPTAHYQTFTAENIANAYSFLQTLSPPYVLKADGLAAGKGVLIINQLEQAKAELNEILLNRKFQQAGQKVVIEQFLDGIELSVFVLTDGKSYLLLPEAKDYKRIGEKDTGLNTGGMGSVSPVPFVNAEFMQKVEKQIITPTIEGLKAEKIDYKGFIFFGLMNVKGDPYVIEYNVRMGDPETESVMPRIQNDIVQLFIATSRGELSQCTLSTDPRAVATIMLVSGGYPQNYEKGKIISQLPENQDSIIFHAGTCFNNKGNLLTNGGRVLACTSFGKDIKTAVDKSAKLAAKIEFEGRYFRKDIGYEFM
ncbi:MAG: phosphoribosylamine--glycine ligase [Bacteroidales bacterium]|jgi:phosphoribosylamine--glycine ligase|nr:phosphoribosylamine--glycine ligase [Bacteroidales bacterium]